MTYEALRVTVRPMTPAEVDEVAAIDADVFDNADPVAGLRKELSLEHSVLEVAVAETGGAPSIAGYINYWLVADEVHLLNIATRPEVRRRGVAARLMRSMLGHAGDAGCRVATLEVRQSNRPAIAMYRAFGFEQVAIRRGYYAKGREDAVVMVCKL